MALTYKQMQDEILSRIHEQHSSNSAIRKRVKQWINIARYQLVAMGPWHFLTADNSFGLVNNQGTYDLDADVQYLNDQEVRLDTTKTRLYYLNDEDFLFAVENPLATGTPVYFRTTGLGELMRLKLYPVPNSAAVTAETSVAYEYSQRLILDLTADGDDSEIPEYAEPVMLDLAEVHAKAWMGDGNGSVAAYQRAATCLEKLWAENSDIMRLRWRSFPPALKIQPHEQMTQSDRS